MGRRGDDGAVRRPDGPGADRAEAPAQRGRLRGPCPTARSWCRRSASTWLDAAGKPARKRIETRLLVRQQGEWTGYSYRWNAEQTDAELVPAAGAARGARGGRPDRAGRPPRAGLAVPRPHRVPGLPLAGSRASSWASARSSSTATATTAAPSTTSSARSSTSACSRARSRAGATTGPGWSTPTRRRPRSRPGSGRTCTSTARPATSRRGAATPAWSWGSTTPLDKMRLIDEVPIHDRFDIPDARLVAPGSPERSVLYQRISRRGTGQMPPAGVDRGRPQGRRTDRRVDPRIAARGSIGFVVFGSVRHSSPGRMA